MESLLPIIIQLISGAAGGSAAGGLLKNMSLGGLGNSLAGAVGGGLLGGKLGGLLGLGSAAAGSGLDLSSILSMVAGGGVGGGATMAVIGILKKLLMK